MDTNTDHQPLKGLHILVPDGMYQDLRRLAFERHVPMADIVRDGIALQLEAGNEGKP